MAKKEFTLVSKILMGAFALADVLHPLMSAREFRRRSLYGGNSYRVYRVTLNRLVRRGLIRIVDKNAERFIKLTKKGELEAFAAKMRLPKEPIAWDGKWRLVMFDIPEEAHLSRDLLRHLLKKQGFRLLQASVWVSPHPLHREVVEYLKEKKLLDYIRVMKVEEMDNDKDLRMKFRMKQ